MSKTGSPAGTGERKPGRPAASDGRQRESLLDAAVLSFAERGIAATRLRQLAATAGVTPAMLHYYFGRKDQLRDAVFQERLLPVVRSLEGKLAATGDADINLLIRAFVEGMHAIIAEHPWLPALWVREVLAEGGQLRSDFIAHIAPIVPKPLIERFARAQRQGRLNAALDPRLLFVSLLGLTLFPFAAAPIWRPGLAANDVDPALLLRHTLALLMEGVLTDAAP